MFEKTNEVYLGQESWLLTFRIPLPKKIILVELYCNMPQCKTAGHIIKSLNLLRMQCIASVNSTGRYYSWTHPIKGSSSSKRGHFDFVGKISKSFGTATSDDIATLKRHMQTLNNNNIHLAEAMSHQDIASIHITTSSFVLHFPHIQWTDLIINNTYQSFY